MRLFPLFLTPHVYEAITNALENGELASLAKKAAEEITTSVERANRRQSVWFRGKNAAAPEIATTDDTDTTDKKTDYYCLIRGVREIRG